MKSLLIILLGVVILSIGQSVNAQNLSTEGREFWVGFMSTWLTGQQHTMEIFVSASDTTRGSYTLPGTSPVEFDVFPNQTTRIAVPTSAMAVGSNNVEDKGIYITSENDVSVFAMNKRQWSADMALVLPTHALSTDYLVMSHWEDGNRNNNNNSDSEFLVVATVDNTMVEIVPSVITEGGNQPNVPFSISLDQGEVYQVQARADLTGTTVTGIDNGSGDCQNFAVFAGNQYTQVGTCGFNNGHEHLYEQMYPINTWGRNYIFMPYQERLGGDIIKILAAHDNTVVSVEGEMYNLNKGEFGQIRQENMSVIESNKPIAVGQFSRTSTCDNQSGDPFFVVLSPNEQLLQKVTYNAPEIATVDEYFLDIITKTATVNTMVLDGTDIGTQFSIVPSKPEFSFAQISTTGGNHTLENPGGFIAYVYGYGDGESFGYATGAGLSNLNLGVSLTNEFGISIPSDSVCLYGTTSFEPLVSGDFETYIWQFGDGTSQTVTTKDPVEHTYAEAGSYLLQLNAFNGAENCEQTNSSTAVRIVKVINPQLPVLGPRSVCPNQEEVSYWFDENKHYTNDWLVSGGEIIVSHQDSIVVNWHDSNDSAWVKVVSTNQFDCVGDTVVFPVRINIELEPEAPFGADSICAAPMNDYFYFAYFLKNSTYNWKVENGEILSGQGTNEVHVNWYDEGNGKLWFDQTAVTDFTCDGTSDTLNVYLQSEPSDVVDIITDKPNYSIGEPINVSFDADSLFVYGNLFINGEVYLDSLLLTDTLEMNFECQNTYDLNLETISAGFCHLEVSTTKQIHVNVPAMEILNVTTRPENDSILLVNWRIEQEQFYGLEFFLQKHRSIITNDIGISDIAVTSYEDVAVNPFSEIYDYNLRAHGDCDNEFLSPEHNSIQLKAIKNVQDEVSLYWNPYINWTNGVQDYEVYLYIDDLEPELIGSSSLTEFMHNYDTAGFNYCFRVKAIENGGNQTESWSNKACAYFVPTIKTYNVFTPNGDGHNDTFLIKNVQNYHNSRLVVVNRAGHTVFDQVGYQNDWTAENLPSGVYYFSLNLNEPRNEQQLYNGIVTILK